MSISIALIIYLEANDVIISVVFESICQLHPRISRGNEGLFIQTLK